MLYLEIICFEADWTGINSFLSLNPEHGIQYIETSVEEKSNIQVREEFSNPYLFIYFG